MSANMSQPLIGMSSPTGKGSLPPPTAANAATIPHQLKANAPTFTHRLVKDKDKVTVVEEAQQRYEKYLQGIHDTQNKIME